MKRRDDPFDIDLKPLPRVLLASLADRFLLVPLCLVFGGLAAAWMRPLGAWALVPLGVALVVGVALSLVSSRSEARRAAPQEDAAQGAMPARVATPVRVGVEPRVRVDAASDETPPSAAEPEASSSADDVASLGR